MANLGSLFVTIGADTKPLKAGLDSAKEDLGSFASGGKAKLAELAAGFNPVTVAVGAAAAAFVAGAAALGVYTKQAFETVDAAAKVADALGDDMKALKGVQFAADLAGVGADQFNSALTRYLDTLGNARNGNKLAAATFEQLGLDVNKLANMAPSAQMAILADTISGVQNAADRARIATDLFGKEAGAKMVNVLRGGAESFAEAQRRAEAFGTAVSRIDAAKIEAANDAITVMQEAFKGIGTRIAIQIAPLLEHMANKISEFAEKNGGFGVMIARSFEWAVKAVGFFADAVHYTTIVLKSAQLGAEVLGLAILKTFEGATAIITTSINGWLMIFNEAIGALNASIGTNFDKVRLLINPISAHANAAAQHVTELALEIDKLAGAKPPSEGIKQFWTELQAAAQQSAEAQVQALNTTTQVTQLIDATGAEEAAKLREQAAQRLEQLQASLDTETEAEFRAWAARREILGQSLQQGLITQASYNAIEEKIEAQHQAKLTEIERRGLSQRALLWGSGLSGQAQILEEGLGNMATLMQTNSAATLEVGKAFAVAQVTVQSIRAAYEAYTSMAMYGAPGIAAGALLAGTIVAAGAHSINNIMQTKLAASSKVAAKSSIPRSSGGASAPLPPTATADRTPVPDSAATSTAAAEPTGPRNISISLNGHSYSREQIAELIEAINDATGDGVKLQVA